MYRLYLDEVGNDDLTHVDDERHRYLSLTGVVMRQDYARDVATPELARFKADTLRHDADTPPILHRKHIMNKKGIFGCLVDDDKCSYFDDCLVQYLSNIEYAVITIVLDKKGMLHQRHWREKHPYHYLMSILVEKYTRFLARKSSIGDMMPEERKGIKDRELQTAYEKVRETGTDYAPRALIETHLRGKRLKFRDKEDNITGLQICDLIAHPSYVDVRRRQNHPIDARPFAQRVIPILQQIKYDRSDTGWVPGYGIKYLP
jgi:hypothetical protein